MLDNRRYRFAICFENYLIIGMEMLHFVLMWLVGACWVTASVLRRSVLLSIVTFTRSIISDPLWSDPLSQMHRHGASFSHRRSISSCTWKPHNPESCGGQRKFSGFQSSSIVAFARKLSLSSPDNWGENQIGLAGRGLAGSRHTSTVNPKTAAKEMQNASMHY